MVLVDGIQGADAEQEIKLLGCTFKDATLRRYGHIAVSAICSRYRLFQSLIFLMSSVAVISRIRVNPNHFLPKSLIDAPM